MRVSKAILKKHNALLGLAGQIEHIGKKVPSVAEPKVVKEESMKKQLTRSMQATFPNTSNIVFSTKEQPSSKHMENIVKPQSANLERSLGTSSPHFVIAEILSGALHKEQTIQRQLIQRRREHSKRISTVQDSKDKKSMYKRRQVVVTEDQLDVPHGERHEVQDLHQSIFRATPLLEEMYEAPEAAESLKSGMTVQDLNRLADFKPPVLQKQIERSLYDEFNQPVFSTDWSKFQVETPSFLQAATMLQKTKTATILSYAQVKELEEEVHLLADEIETGDYSRYNDPAKLLGHLNIEESSQQVKNIMIHAAQSIGFNTELHPITRKDMMSTIFSVVSRIDKKPMKSRP